MRADIPQLADFIETVPDAMAITEVDGNMRRISGPWPDLFGYGADDCIGQRLVMVLQPGAIPSMDWMRGCALKPQRLEVVGRRKDGVRFPVDFRTTPLKTAHGAVRLAGGWWKLESHPGAGTSVAFWLPAVPQLTLPSPQALPTPA